MECRYYRRTTKVRRAKPTSRSIPLRGEDKEIRKVLTNYRIRPFVSDRLLSGALYGVLNSE